MSIAAAPVAPASHVTSAPEKPRGMRAEIQGLRALAVALVVLYHLWPHRLTGGFVGVDVFFVISGFLITSHLAREVLQTGGVRIGQFWARRIRRLLPASLLVLTVTGVAVLALVSPLHWQQFMRDIVASTLYVQNWNLAAEAVDYLAADNAASPVQHFWSLSVEEQFYLVWPLMIVAAVTVAHRRGWRVLTSMRVLLGAILVASFAWSVAEIASGSSVAYFSTFVRAWEFAAGGLLGLFGLVAATKVRAPRILSWTGLAMIVASAVLYTDATPFPGASALLPVLGTVLVIAAGDPQGRLSTRALYRWRAVQWLGDISYSLYLWHWPLIILVPAVLDRELRWTDKLILLGVALALSALTKHFVEDRMRFNSATGRRSVALTLAAAVAAMGVAVAPAAYGMNEIAQQEKTLEADRLRIEESIAQGASSDVCVGAQAMAFRPGCTTDWTVPLTPSPAVSASDLPLPPGCATNQFDSRVYPCTFGSAKGRVKVALLGDSHAAHWFPAVEVLAKKHGWDLTVYTKNSCPWNVAAQDWTGTKLRRSCASWNTTVTKKLLADPPTLILTSAIYGKAWGEGKSAQAAAVDGYARTWRKMANAGSRVIPILDIPLTTEEARECLVAKDPAVKKCGTTRAIGFSRPNVLGQAAAKVTRVKAADLSRFFCTSDWCPAAAGSVTIYRDLGHMTATYSTTLGPYLEKRIPEKFYAAQYRG